MGVSFHQAWRRVEGREIAAFNLTLESRQTAEPHLNDDLAPCSPRGPSSNIHASGYNGDCP